MFHQILYLNCGVSLYQPLVLYRAVLDLITPPEQFVSKPRHKENPFVITWSKGFFI